MRRKLVNLFAALLLTGLMVWIGLLLMLGNAGAQPATTDPPLCRLVSLQAQNASGGLSTAWFNWCGYTTPDGPNPLRNWVGAFVGSGFRFDAAQCPKANPCTIFGVP